MHLNAVHPSSPNSSQSEDDAATKIQAQWKGYRVRKQLRTSRRSKNENKMNGNSSERNSVEERSATRIQASWKGFKTRRDIQTFKVAATKIQAGWKGFKTRKELKKQSKSSNKSE